MHQLICEPFETRSLSKEKSLTLYDKWSILPADFLYYKYFNDFMRTTRMNAFNLIIEEKQDEICKENMDNIYIPPYGKEYINDYEYVYWYPADEYFATYSLSPYLARAISNMAAVKNYTLVAHSQCFPEEAERYINENNTRHFVAGKYRNTTGGKESFQDKIYFECRPAHFEDVFRRTTGDLDHVTGFVLEGDKYDELRKLIIADEKHSKWIINIMDVSALWFESIRHNVGLRIMSKEIGINRFIKLGKLKEINDEMKTIENNPKE
ncbi:MAG TPA: hypothetical protein PLS19_16090 [bacterium]|nr:hypothetical protein [bacterium]